MPSIRRLTDLDGCYPWAGVFWEFT